MDLTYRSRAQLITVKQNSFQGQGPSYTMAAYQQQEANSYTWHVNAQDFEQHTTQQYHHHHHHHQPPHAPTQMMDVNTSWSY
ncbi:hypothetical protein DOY81_001699 [Sarcophaga bullata]|nr:hypothetical protein DOY81_001699 [Sarcophaga bullata]